VRHRHHDPRSNELTSKVMPKALRCRLGMHLWRLHRNDQGQRYRTCERCGKDDDPGGRVTMPGGG